jgi:hypothetical protein
MCLQQTEVGIGMWSLQTEHEPLKNKKKSKEKKCNVLSLLLLARRHRMGGGTADKT